MNTYEFETTAEYNRQRTHAEIEQIRFEKDALKNRPYQPGRFTHVMFSFANWMIATGKQLRKRYEVPVANSNQAPSKNFAH